MPKKHWLKNIKFWMEPNTYKPTNHFKLIQIYIYLLPPVDKHNGTKLVNIRYVNTIPRQIVSTQIHINYNS